MLPKLSMPTMKTLKDDGIFWNIEAKEKWAYEDKYC